MSITPSVYAKARAEITALFGWNADELSADQTLRLDCAVALRLALDDLQGRIVRGESADVARMLTASEALARLLPPAVLATPPAEQDHADPRQQMWEIYRTMRSRGELPLKPLAPSEGGQVEALQAKVAELEARLAGKPLTTITPPLFDIVPPNERAECDAGPQVGPDDPPPRSTRVIEGKANAPAASATSATSSASRPPDWDSTPGGVAWRQWFDAGGSGGGDPWANRNIP